MRASTITLGLVASLLASTVATAQPTVVRASPVGPAAVAVVRHRLDATLWRWDDRLAPVATTFTGTWIHDARFGPDGHLWVATSAAPRVGDVSLRDLDGGRSIALPDSGSPDGLRLVFVGPSARVIDPDGVWTVTPAGPSYAPFTTAGGGYGFYAASTYAFRDGSVSAFVPEFNTCGSSDRLEGLSLLRHAHGRTARVSLPIEHLNALPAFGAGGVVYAARSRGSTCVLTAARGDATRDLWSRPDARCAPLVAHDARFTVAVIEDRVLRLEPDRADDLGGISPDRAEIVDLAVDSRGRALTLDRDGSVWRHAAREVPVRLITNLRPPPPRDAPPTAPPSPRAPPPASSPGRP